AVRRPRRHEVEPQARFDLLGVGTVRVSEEEPVCPVFEGAALAVRREGPAVDEILDQRARFFVLDRGLLRRFAAGQVYQVRVVANTIADGTEVLVLLFPLTDLVTLPAATEPGRLSVGRPADELRRVVRLAR